MYPGMSTYVGRADADPCAVPVRSDAIEFIRDRVPVEVDFVGTERCDADKLVIVFVWDKKSIRLSELLERWHKREGRVTGSAVRR